VIVVGAGAGVLFLLVVIIMLASGRKPRGPDWARNYRSRTTTLPANPGHVGPRGLRTPRNWYQVGYSDGLDWKRRTRTRHGPVDPATVELVAENMTSNYVHEGITKQGEAEFVRGFKRAVLGR
jgi:hypothetical protein